MQDARFFELVDTFASTGFSILQYHRAEDLRLDSLCRRCHSRAKIGYSDAAVYAKQYAKRAAEHRAAAKQIADCFGELRARVRNLNPAASLALAQIQIPPSHTLAIDDDEVRLWTAAMRNCASLLAYATDLVATDEVWFHGDLSYSLPGATPTLVTNEEHAILTMFLARKTALNTKVLGRKVANPSRVIRKLRAKFGEAIRTPKRKGEGYFVNVISAPQK